MKAWIGKNFCLGIISIHLFKPYKLHGRWVNETGHDIQITEQDLPEGINPQWSDDEPIEVELKIERVKQ